MRTLWECYTDSEAFERKMAHPVTVINVRIVGFFEGEIFIN